jgi:hypothetical protein
MEMPVEIYEQSAVAFIDILGFKNALVDETKARGILDVLSHVKEKVEEYYSDPWRQQWQGILDIELTAFSDSIVISGSEGQTIIVLLAALEFSQLLIEKGFLCRGAVACGELYHKNGVLFGAGLVKAFQAETSQAIYPRIILGNETVKTLQESKNSINDFAGLIKVDKDGNQFLNILYQEDKSIRNIKIVLSALVKKKIEENLSSPRVTQKLVWLKNEYSI